MSFITRDPWLLREFESIIKGAQAAPVPTPAPTAPTGPSTLKVAQYLLLRLGQQLNGMPALSSGKGEAQENIKVQDLQNIEVFVQYLEKNQIMIDGQRVAYKADDFKLNEQQAKDYGSLTTRVAEPQGGAGKDQKWGQGDYRVNLPGIFKYLTYLQRKASNEKNKVLEVMVGKMIGFANTYWDANISTKPKTVPGQTSSELPPETSLDGFPENFIFDAADKSFQSGNIPLLAGDIDTVGTLNSWIAKNAFKVKPVADPKNPTAKTDPLSWEDPNANHCTAIQVMYNRAKIRAANWKTKEDKINFEFYKTRIAQLGSQIEDPSGKPCQIVGTTGTAPGAPSASTTGPAKPATDQALYDLLQKLPFRTDYVNIQLFNQFNLAYLAITGGDHHAEVNNMKTEVDSKITEVHAYSSSAAPQYPLQSGAGAAERLAGGYAKKPPADNIGRLIAELKLLVSLEMSIVEDFMNRYGGGGVGSDPNAAKLRPEQVAVINGQLEIAKGNATRLSNIAWEWQALVKGQGSK